MLPSPLPGVRPRARRLLRFAAPAAIAVTTTTGLVAGALVAAAPASAEAATGSYTIGDAPIELNQPTDIGLGTLTPSADAAENGMYGPLTAWPIVALHATVARNGRLITYGTPQGTVSQAGVVYDSWSTVTGAHDDSAVMYGYDSFCNSAVTLADGRLLMVSGQVMDDRDATMMTMLYDPTTGAQTMGADLAYKRWYPTSLRLTDNRILLLGGADAGNTAAYQTPDDNSKVAPTPEIGTGTGAWSDLPGASSTALFGADQNRWWYPRAFNGPNGTVVGFSGDRIWSLDVTGDGSVQQTGTLPFDPKVSGSQVMYAPGKILIAGGGQVNNTEEATATAQAAILDVNGATPQVALTDPMHFARNWLNLTVLPTGEVFGNGGTIVGTDGGDANSVKQAEIWNPGTGSWRTAATAQATRTYHSTSVLLPSGAVFTGGGGNPGPVDNFNAELYYPASLFTKSASGAVTWASRPQISTISGSATSGGTVRLGIADGRDIASASLITLPSVTHSQNTDQRRIPLDVTQQGDTVSATLPASVNTMPPGDYELTVVDSKGVPSAAQIITIRPGQAGLVTIGEGVKTTAAATAPAAGTATGTTPSTGTASGTGTVTTPGSGTGAGTAKTFSMTKGRSVGLQPVGSAGTRVSHTGSKVSVKKAGAKSAKSLRRSTSFVIRTGLGSKKGYSFESVDRPGWFLAAPKHGAGTVTLVKKSSSAAFKKRATFSSIKGVLGHDVSFRLTSTPSLYLRVDGSRVVVHKLSEASSTLKASTFVMQKGLAAGR